MSKMNPDFWEVVVETARLEAFTTDDALWHDYNASRDEREERQARTRETFDRVMALVHSELTPRQRQVVEYRFFGGLEEKEIAQVLGITERTVRRDWVKARAWLYRELYPDADPPST